MISAAKTFVWMVASLQLMASISYYIGNDWRRGTLWLCWSVGSIVVTIN